MNQVLKNKEFLTTIGILLFGLFVVWHSMSLPLMGPRALSPGIFPLVSGLFILVFALIKLLKYAMATPSRSTSGSTPAAGAGGIRVLLILLLLFGFSYLLPIIHFLPATICFLVLAMSYNQGRFSWKFLLISGGTALVIYYAFKIFFRVMLP